MFRPRASRRILGQQPKSKYRNKKTVVDGHTFDSKKEAERWGQLKNLEKAGLIRSLNRQRVWPLDVSGVEIGSYVSDFSYLWPVDSDQWVLVVEDVKGVLTPLFRWKARHFAAQYGFFITLWPARKGRTRGKHPHRPVRE